MNSLDSISKVYFRKVKKPKLDTPLSAREKQEIWRRKQVKIFYGSGRPIFLINDKNQHLKRFNDSQFWYEMNKFRYPYFS